MLLLPLMATVAGLSVIFGYRAGQGTSSGFLGALGASMVCAGVAWGTWELLKVLQAAVVLALLLAAALIFQFLRHRVRQDPEREPGTRADV